MTSNEKRWKPLLLGRLTDQNPGFEGIIHSKQWEWSAEPVPSFPQESYNATITYGVLAVCANFRLQTIDQHCLGLTWSLNKC